MAEDTPRTRAAAATVTICDSGACGVLVPGQVVLTAAHNVQWEGMRAKPADPWSDTAWRQKWVEQVAAAWASDGARHAGIKERVTFNNVVYELAILGVEPVSDIAVLDAATDVAFARRVASVPPVPVRDETVGSKLPVHALKLDRTWTAGTACDVDGPSARLFASEPLKPGTSGGPVLDGDGRLVALVSRAVSEADDHQYVVTLPPLALPVWIWQRVQSAQRPLG